MHILCRSERQFSAVGRRNRQIKLLENARSNEFQAEATVDYGPILEDQAG
jgi:hypothetical protein